MIETKEIATYAAGGRMNRRIQDSLTVAFMAGERTEGTRFGIRGGYRGDFGRWGCNSAVMRIVCSMVLAEL